MERNVRDIIRIVRSYYNELAKEKVPVFPMNWLLLENFNPENSHKVKLNKESIEDLKPEVLQEIKQELVGR